MKDRWIDQSPRERWLRSRQKARGRAIVMKNAAKQRASKLGLDFDLTREWIEEKLEVGECEMTGLPFNLTLSGRMDNPYAPSLDRIDPERGYTQSNVRVCLWMYNAAKGMWQEEDVLAMAIALVEKSYVNS